jgi:L,D-peptidoglycan transpeptidase YkuD (ErfK/YbiS/YcfS/YnhG family)
MTTPAGKYRLLFGFFRKDRLGLLSGRLPFSATAGNDGWCDAPQNPNYNRKIRLPFSASNETLMRNDALYDIVIVMDHNYTRRVRGRGSAVFFHLTGEKGYTAGCVAVSRKDMLQILPQLSTQTFLEVLP